MSKHTPGPWVATYYPDDHAMIDGVIYVSAGDACVSHANARLIAAAPDLLEALEFVAKLMHSDTTAKGKADYSVVRDAINKAKGV
jgi:hypothetical protein